MKRKIIFELIAPHGPLHPNYDLSELSTLIKIKRRKRLYLKLKNTYISYIHCFIIIIWNNNFFVKKIKMSTDKEK